MFTSKPCPICGADVRLDAAAEQMHSDWHGAVSGVAIESTKLIDLLRRDIDDLRRGMEVDRLNRQVSE